MFYTPYNEEEPPGSFLFFDTQREIIMATHNQKVVAEALHRVRETGSFGNGFSFLRENIKPKSDTLVRARLVWFANKCVEHGILDKEQTEQQLNHI